MSEIIEYGLIFLAIVFAITVHEFAHGLTSVMFGDPTPKFEKRLSLNPIKHLDVVGTLCLLFFQFGWGKPVRVDLSYYKNPKQGMFYVSLAGPLSNFIFGFIAMLILSIFTNNTTIYVGSFNHGVYLFLYYLVIINIGLAVFNLIPIPPLDGSKMLGAFLSEEKYYKLLRFEQYGIIVLLLLLYIPFFNDSLYKIQIGVFDLYQEIVYKILGYSY